MKIGDKVWCVSCSGVGEGNIISLHEADSDAGLWLRSYGMPFAVVAWRNGDTTTALLSDLYIPTEEDIKVITA